MPWLVRRVLLVPAMVALAGLFCALLPLVAFGQLLVAGINLIRRRRPRWRALRCAIFAVVYTVGEVGCLLACLGLWLASPVPRWRDATRWRHRHVRLLQAFLDVLIAFAGWVFGFRLRLEEPRDTHAQEGVPLIVLGRHAGPGASFVMIHVLVDVRSRVPRIVLKSQLRLDPAIDVLLTRIGCAFISKGDAATDAVARLAGALNDEDALVIFPEGSDWTPTRHRLAVARLRLKGLRRQAREAAAMPHVLPPRPAGTLAALRAAPDAGVAVFMHTGHDDLLDAGSVWRALPLRRELHMVWWNEARPDVLDEEGCAAWLGTVWANIDAWIDEQTHVATLSTTGSSADPPDGS